MRLPEALTLPVRIRAQRRIVRRGVWTQPITGAYDVPTRDRRQAELAAIVEKI